MGRADHQVARFDAKRFDGAREQRQETAVSLQNPRDPLKAGGHDAMARNHLVDRIVGGKQRVDRSLRELARQPGEDAFPASDAGQPIVNQGNARMSAHIVSPRTIR
jgi:hypothetical protein